MHVVHISVLQFGACLFIGRILSIYLLLTLGLKVSFNPECYCVSINIKITGNENVENKPKMSDNSVYLDHMTYISRNKRYENFVEVLR